jgi:NTP pyrophosphatase (non-canonical NTP hydrolase)
MTMAAKGVAKLIEECGELQQVLGKRLAWWSTDEPHWDGSDLDQRIAEEMGDVFAAIWFVVDKLGLDADAIKRRHVAKSDLFHEWEADPHNNDHGIDG